MGRDLNADELSWLGLHASLVDAAQRTLPADSVPCFGAIGVERAGKLKHYVLGPRTTVGGEVSILDWRTAPLAAAFFTGDVELEVDGRALEGTLIDRALYTLADDGLVELSDSTRRLRRVDGAWQSVEPRPPLFTPRTETERRRSAGSLLVELDPHQRQAVELPASRSLLVLGEAGFGKTTVALHRAARLEAQALAAGRRFNALVIVPTRGLERLSKLTLDRLGARYVEVATYDHWILEQARLAYPKLPNRTSSEAALAVLKLKRHPALDRVLPAIAKGKGAIKRTDLLKLFGDRALLETVASASNGAIGARAIEEVLEHTHVQFQKSTEREYRHVDRDRLETLDGRRIDAGTPLEDAGSLDVEDGAVLFELQRLRDGLNAAREGRFRTYDHLVLDEAQELAPIELRVIGRALSPGGSITLSGDAHQQTDDSSYFSGWDQALVEVGQGNAERVLLTESYRSPPAVTEYARAIIQGTANVTGVPIGGGLLASVEPAHFHVVIRIVDALAALERADPGATIAVVCKDAGAAKRLHRELDRGHPVRLALDGEIDFRPGTVITEIAEVKGLELDYVVIPDADEHTYPPTNEARRALYVALTRALHQVALVR